MKIGFDAKRLFNNFTGLGNYSRFVVQALLEFEKSTSLVLYTPGVKSADIAEIHRITAAPNVSVIFPPAFYQKTRTTSWWRTFGIARERSTASLDVFHGLSQELPSGLPGGVKKVVTVHDLIFLRFPGLYSFIDRRIYAQKVKKACATADTVVCISQQTAQDVMAFLGTPERKITVIYQDAHPQFSSGVADTVIQEVKSRWNLPSAYMLTVGTVEPRKNQLAAIEAIGRLPPSLRLPLVIVGRETAHKQILLDAARKLGVLNDVIFLHHVPFADLPALYQGSTLFVYPSLFEGFGIPIVEALHGGVPVITSTGSCFSEAGGGYSLYADPSQPDQLAAHMANVLTDRELRNQMVKKGLEHVEMFAPGRIARQLGDVYRK